MTKSCVEIWVGKIKGDYERFSKAVSDEMSQASSKFSKSIQCKDLHTCAHSIPLYIYVFFLIRDVTVHALKSTAVVQVWRTKPSLT